MKVYSHNETNESNCFYGLVVVDNDTITEKCEILDKRLKGELEFVVVEKALEITSGEIEIFLESEYVIKCLTIWYKGWQRNGWKTSKGMPVKHKTNIEKCLNLMENRNVKFTHARPHEKNEHKKKAEELVRSLCEKDKKTLHEQLHQPCHLFFPQTNQLFKFNSVYDLGKQANL